MLFKRDLLFSVLIIWTFAALLSNVEAKVQFKVKCSEESMVVELRKTDDVKDIFLENLKHYPDPACHPVIEGSLATFKLSLSDVFQCAVTRLRNQATGVTSYYHKIFVESENQKEIIHVKCIEFADQRMNHTIVRRNVLPAGFQEPDTCSLLSCAARLVSPSSCRGSPSSSQLTSPGALSSLPKFRKAGVYLVPTCTAVFMAKQNSSIDLEITTSLTSRAPEPQLGVGVRQGGQLLTGELNVNSGTPLQMEIFLDKSSAPIYGLLVSYMQVTDTKKQEETIIFNGCSVDPYLFENFNTVDGDFLAAKFRAFKFPESTYVQFKGTVNVCLDKCRGVECSNGQVGYGRRKRAVRQMPHDPNKIFEMTITSFIKVNYKGDSLLEKAKLDSGLEQTKDMTAAGTQNNDVTQQHLKLDTEEIREDLMYTTLIEEKNASTSLINMPTLIMGSIVFVFALRNLFSN
ncbi:uncharacterized protein LOC111044976 isoform X1 [Nilaparvata lugens]|uniref:uncharacterized protein LOC111044976 isoform X1 n=1 Tax=Nilaparvata lugens TaxID=108931 RepID=UPI00193E2ABE|nr:uncharacterized protein LOC111044976 isoform X1 [Nilaparvata lugens]